MELLCYSQWEIQALSPAGPPLSPPTNQNQRRCRRTWSRRGSTCKPSPSRDKSHQTGAQTGPEWDPPGLATPCPMFTMETQTGVWVGDKCTGERDALGENERERETRGWCLQSTCGLFVFSVGHGPLVASGSPTSSSPEAHGITYPLLTMYIQLWDVFSQGPVWSSIEPGREDALLPSNTHGCLVHVYWRNINYMQVWLMSVCESSVGEMFIVFIVKISKANLFQKQDISYNSNEEEDDETWLNLGQVTHFCRKSITKHQCYNKTSML